MARSKQQRLDDVARRAAEWRDANAAAQVASDRLDVALARARVAGLSLRTIAATADVSDVTVLNRTRDALDALA